MGAGPAQEIHQAGGEDAVVAEARKSCQARIEIVVGSEGVAAHAALVIREEQLLIAHHSAVFEIELFGGPEAHGVAAADIGVRRDGGVGGAGVGFLDG